VFHKAYKGKITRRMEMGVAVYIPNWFYWLDVLFEFLFLIVTVTISTLSYKIYKITKHKASLLFSYAFGSISLSYLFKSLLNVAIYKRVSYGGEAYKLVRDVISLRDIGRFVQCIFMLLGLFIIIYIFVKNKDTMLFSLTALLTFVIAIISQHKDNLVYIVISLFFIYILTNYWNQYKQFPTKNKLLVLAGFLLLGTGNTLFIFMPMSQYFYVAGHLAELAGYILLASNLLLVFKKR